MEDIIIEKANIRKRNRRRLFFVVAVAVLAVGSGAFLAAKTREKDFALSNYKISNFDPFKLFDFVKSYLPWR